MDEMFARMGQSRRVGSLVFPSEPFNDEQKQKQQSKRENRK